MTRQGMAGFIDEEKNRNLEVPNQTKSKFAMLLTKKVRIILVKIFYDSVPLKWTSFHAAR